MSLGPAFIQLALDLRQRGLLKASDALVAMSDQEMQLSLAQFEELMKKNNILTYDRKNFSNLDNYPEAPYCAAQNFFASLGIAKYSFADHNKKRGALLLDIEAPETDASLQKQFDAVIDYGGKQPFHIAQQYKTMHQLCKKGGLFIITQEVWNGKGHYLFDLSFFEGLAAANHYRILFSSFIVTVASPTSPGEFKQFHIPCSRHMLDSLQWANTAQIEICYVMQKIDDNNFRLPYQAHFLSQKYGNFGYKIHYQANPPSRIYEPILSSSVEDVSLKELLTCFMKKVKRKLLL